MRSSDTMYNVKMKVQGNESFPRVLFSRGSSWRTGIQCLTRTFRSMLSCIWCCDFEVVCRLELRGGSYIYLDSHGFILNLIKVFLYVSFFLSCRCIPICGTTKPLIFCHIAETELRLLWSNFRVVSVQAGR